MRLIYNYLSRLFRSLFIRKELYWFLRLSYLRLRSLSYKNFYYNEKLIAKNLNKSFFYKDVVGGDWDNIGNLQLDYLVSHKLKKNHKLLDIGCGTLRGGVKFCNYLNSNNYYGFDKLESFLKIGYEKEIKEKGLQKKLDFNNLSHGPNFDFSYPLEYFDYALSISLFYTFAN